MDDFWYHNTFVFRIQIAVPMLPTSVYFPALPAFDDVSRPDVIEQTSPGFFRYRLIAWFNNHPLPISVAFLNIKILCNDKKCGEYCYLLCINTHSFGTDVETYILWDSSVLYLRPHDPWTMYSQCYKIGTSFDM